MCLHLAELWMTEYISTRRATVLGAGGTTMRRHNKTVQFMRGVGLIPADPRDVAGQEAPKLGAGFIGLQPMSSMYLCSTAALWMSMNVKTW